MKASPARRTVVGHSNVKVNVLPPKEFLDECFEYFPETGELRWKRRPLHHFKDARAMKSWNTQNGGAASGVLDGFGHLMTSMKYNGVQKRYQNHRIIFGILEIFVPDGKMIDHINRISDDNRRLNLRIVNTLENAYNSEAVPRVRNHDLPRGVYPNGKGFQAKIRHNYKEICLGTFKTPELAHLAFEVKARELRGDFAVTD